MDVLPETIAGVSILSNIGFTLDLFLEGVDLENVFIPIAHIRTIVLIILREIHVTHLIS